MSDIKAIATCGLVYLINLGLEGSELSRFEKTEPHMGTHFRIVLYAKNSTTADNAFRAAFERVESLNEIFSDYLPDSELSQLSLTAGREKRLVSAKLRKYS